MPKNSHKNKSFLDHLSNFFNSIICFFLNIFNFSKSPTSPNNYRTAENIMETLKIGGKKRKNISKK